MKKLSLEKTWSEELEMCKWIAEQRKKIRTPVVELKRQYLKKRGIGEDELRHDCFFCQYACNNGDGCQGEPPSCPAKMIDKGFSCCDTPYDYEDRPIAFYRKLISLNKQRLAKKKKK